MQVSPSPVACECPLDSSPATSLSSTPQNRRRGLPSSRSFCRSADPAGAESSSARFARSTSLGSPAGAGAGSTAGSGARSPADRISMDVPVTVLLRSVLQPLTAPLHLTDPHSPSPLQTMHPSQPLTSPHNLSQPLSLPLRCCSTGRLTLWSSISQPLTAAGVRPPMTCMAAACAAAAPN
eukprot:scaffold23658_cov61-Phaeocystis_antarctica.AAC.7